LQLALAGEEFLAKGGEVHFGLLRFREHAARLLFFLDMMLYHLGEHRHFGIEIIILGSHALNLGNQLLGAVVFDHSLMMDILVLSRLQERGVEDLLLNGCMYGEGFADIRRQLLLLRGTPSTFEFREPSSTWRWSALRSEIASWTEFFLRVLAMAVFPFDNTVGGA
jgi:hypothetical protein